LSAERISISVVLTSLKENEVLEIRRFKAQEARRLWELKYQTIREYCIKDYSLEQVKVWAPNIYDEETWISRLIEKNPFVAIHDANIVGFADLQPDGYIDQFFCSSNYIGKGIGGHLMRHIIKTAETSKIQKLYSHVSLSAKPFFSHFNFTSKKTQQVYVSGVMLTNFEMERRL